VKRFRGGLVFKAHRLLYHSTLGVRVIKKKTMPHTMPATRAPSLLQEIWGSGFRSRVYYIVVVAGSGSKG